jgi:hypothetical protein
MPDGKRSTPGGALRGKSRQGGFGVSSGGPPVYSSAPPNHRYYPYKSPNAIENTNYEPPGFSDIYDKAVEAQEEIARMHEDPDTLESTYKEAVTGYLNLLKSGVDMCDRDEKAKASTACKAHKDFYTTTSATYKDFNTNAESRAQGGRRRSRTRTTRKARSRRMRKSRRV